MTCNCNNNYGCDGVCDPCSSNTAIKQAVNDAVAAEKETLEGYVEGSANSASEASTSAANAASSASAAAQSQTNAETAASTAVKVSSSVNETAEVLEETATAVKAAQNLLDDKIWAIQTKPVYFEVKEATSSLVLPESETIFNVRSIYVASARQDIGYGFEFNKTNQTITLAEPITSEQIAESIEGYILVTVICDLVNSDDPTTLALVLESNAGAGVIGTTSGKTVQETLTNLSGKVDPTLRVDLASSENSKGATLVALNQGGNVQNVINYVTLEMLGGGVAVEDNSPAMQKFSDLVDAGTYTELRLGSGEYRMKSSVVFNSPHTITGVGANFIQGTQKGESKIIDDRIANAEDFLITIKNPSDTDSSNMIYGWRWQNFSIAGVRSRNNRGVYFRGQGWAFRTDNIFIRDFGKTGLALNYTADGEMIGVFIGNCGGLVDDKVYYGLDFYPEDFDTIRGVANLIGIYRLHIEHCRYMMRLAGFDVAFTDSHFEIGSVTYPDENTPVINVARLLRPISFNNCYFTSPGWEYLTSGYTGTDYASKIAAIPAMIGSTYPDTVLLGGGEYDSKIELNHCKLTAIGGYALYVNLPTLPVNINESHLMQVGCVNSRVPFRVGPRSKITLNKFFVKAVSSNDGPYAAYVVSKVAPAIQVVTGTATIIGNEFYLFNASPTSLAACVISARVQAVASANQIAGYTQSIGGDVMGDQLRKALRITDGTNRVDIEGYNTVCSQVSSGNTFEWRLSDTYTQSYLRYSAESDHFRLTKSSSGGIAYLGTSSLPWTGAYFTNTPTVISDSRSKTDISSFTEDEKAVALVLKSKLCKYRLLEETARDTTAKTHIGIIAQDIVTAFEEKGLDAEKYGIVVHDTWESQKAEYDSNGVEVNPAIEAGDRYGVNYSELLTFIVAAL